MEIWEYPTTRIRLAQLSSPNRKTFWDWVEDQQDGSLLTGINVILNRYGEKGWELISLIPELVEGLVADFASSEARAYRAVFKKRMQ